MLERRTIQGCVCVKVMELGVCLSVCIFFAFGVHFLFRMIVHYLLD